MGRSKRSRRDDKEATEQELTLGDVEANTASAGSSADNGWKIGITLFMMLLLAAGGAIGVLLLRGLRSNNISSERQVQITNGAVGLLQKQPLFFSSVSPSRFPAKRAVCPSLVASSSALLANSSATLSSPLVVPMSTGGFMTFWNDNGNSGIDYMEVSNAGTVVPLVSGKGLLIANGVGSASTLGSFTQLSGGQFGMIAVTDGGSEIMQANVVTLSTSAPQYLSNGETYLNGPVDENHGSRSQVVPVGTGFIAAYTFVQDPRTIIQLTTLRATGDTVGATLTSGMPSGNQYQPSLAMFPNGASQLALVYITDQVNGATTSPTAMLEIRNATISAAPALSTPAQALTLLEGADPQSNPSVAVLGTGPIYTIAVSVETTPGGLTSVGTQLFSYNSTSNVLAAITSQPTIMNSVTTGNQLMPKTTVTPTGVFKVTWSGIGQGSTYGQFGRTITPSGTLGQANQVPIQTQQTSTTVINGGNVAVSSAGEFYIYMTSSDVIQGRFFPNNLSAAASGTLSYTAGQSVALQGVVSITPSTSLQPYTALLTFADVDMGLSFAGTLPADVTVTNPAAGQVLITATSGDELYSVINCGLITTTTGDVGTSHVQFAINDGQTYSNSTLTLTGTGPTPTATATSSVAAPSTTAGPTSSVGATARPTTAAPTSSVGVTVGPTTAAPTSSVGGTTTPTVAGPTAAAPTSDNSPTGSALSTGAVVGYAFAGISALAGAGTFIHRVLVTIKQNAQNQRNASICPLAYELGRKLGLVETGMDFEKSDGDGYAFRAAIEALQLALQRELNDPQNMHMAKLQAGGIKTTGLEMGQSFDAFIRGLPTTNPKQKQAKGARNQASQESLPSLIAGLASLLTDDQYVGPGKICRENFVVEGARRILGVTVPQQLQGVGTRVYTFNSNALKRDVKLVATVFLDQFFVNFLIMHGRTNNAAAQDGLRLYNASRRPSRSDDGGVGDAIPLDDFNRPGSSSSFNQQADSQTGLMSPTSAPPAYAYQPPLPPPLSQQGDGGARRRSIPGMGGRSSADN